MIGQDSDVIIVRTLRQLIHNTRLSLEFVCVESVCDGAQTHLCRLAHDLWINFCLLNIGIT